MQWTTLGRFGPFPAPGGATSGHLLECEPGTRILADCGSGVISRMMACGVRPGALTAVVLTHLHQDHMADMGVLQYALEDLRKRGYDQPPLKVFLPETPVMEGAPWHAPVFEPHVIRPDLKVQAGDITMTFCRVFHPVETYAVRFDGPGCSVVYSGDTGECDALAPFAEGCDLMVCDARFFQEEYKPGLAHLTAVGAAEMANRAGARRLLLTHLPPDDELEELQAQARLYFSDARLAREGRTVRIRERRK